MTGNMLLETGVRTVEYQCFLNDIKICNSGHSFNLVSTFPLTVYVGREIIGIIKVTGLDKVGR